MTGRRVVSWGGPNARGAGGAAPFRSRLGGANLAKRVWICPACRRWHDAEDPAGPVAVGEPVTRKKARPPACAGCGERALLYFDSRGEAQHFLRLWMLVDRGEVRGLKHHPRFYLAAVTPGGRLEVIGYYEADAEYEIRRGAGWERRVEDFKPRNVAAQDPLFRWKRRHVEAQYGIEIRIVTA